MPPVNKPRPRAKPLKPLMVVQERGDTNSVGASLVNVHLVDAAEAGRATFLSGVAIPQVEADRWVQWFQSSGYKVEYQPAETGPAEKGGAP